MTKYVLNSGGINNNPEAGKRFFAEMVKGLGDKPRILTCLFAQLREDWESRFSENERNSPRFFPEGVHPIFELAFPSTFEEQMKASDAIYIYGGDSHLIQYWMKQFNIPEIWDGKVVATNSAGSDMLSKQFWTCDWRACMDGLGILPIKFLSHYESSYGADDPRGPVDWKGAYEELTQYGDTSLPIHALKEGEYVVFEQ